MRKFSAHCLYYLQMHRLFQFLHRKKTIILMYHGFTDKKKHDGIENYQGKHINNELFRSQIKYIKEHYNVISLDHFIECCTSGELLPEKSIIITIDDGYKSNYTLAFPIFKEFDVPATIFLTTDFIDNKNYLWVDRLEYTLNNTKAENLKLQIGDEELVFSIITKADKIICEKMIRRRLKIMPHETIDETVKDIENQLKRKLTDATKVPEIYKPLEWDEILEMTNTSKVCIGSHTHKHLILARYDNTVIQNELTLSKEIIERNIGINTRLFCYPNGAFGDFNEHTRQIVRESGYSCALTTVKGLKNEFSDLFELKRLSIENTDLKSFIVTTSGLRHFFSKITSRNNAVS